MLGTKLKIRTVALRTTEDKWYHMLKNEIQNNYNNYILYFKTSVHKIIYNIVSSQLYLKNIKKHKDRGPFDIQNIERVGQTFYILTIFIP